jgi:DNA-binding transcriptional MocR family regulator
MRPAFAKASTRSLARTDPIYSNTAIHSVICPCVSISRCTAQSDQILLTNGTSQALELVITCLLKPGDSALVDDPGYYNTFGNLRLRGIEMLAVPRNRDGPDVSVLEALAFKRRPKIYFTQSVMRNPSGTDMSPHVAFRVLQAAERHNFVIVEDDIFSDLQGGKHHGWRPSTSSIG